MSEEEFDALAGRALRAETALSMESEKVSQLIAVVRGIVDGQIEPSRISFDGNSITIQPPLSKEDDHAD